jgi:hypothetical protein
MLRFKVEIEIGGTSFEVRELCVYLCSNKPDAVEESRYERSLSAASYTQSMREVILSLLTRL